MESDPAVGGDWIRHASSVGCSGSSAAHRQWSTPHISLITARLARPPAGFGAALRAAGLALLDAEVGLLIRDRPLEAGQWPRLGEARPRSAILDAVPFCFFALSRTADLLLAALESNADGICWSAGGASATAGCTKAGARRGLHGRGVGGDAARTRPVASSMESPARLTPGNVRCSRSWCALRNERNSPAPGYVRPFLKRCRSHCKGGERS